MNAVPVPVQLIAPFAAGGGSDEAARAFARYAAPRFSGGIAVVNRTGSSGATGFRAGADAPADGRTLTLMVASLIAGPHAGDGYAVSYRDFTPVCLLATMPLVLCVRADSSLRTFTQMLDDARERPGQLTLGTAGRGSFVDLAARALGQITQLSFVLRALAGSAEQIEALLAGALDVAQISLDEALPLVRTGRLRALAVVGSETSLALPGVPTTAEHGIALDIGFFRGLGAPRGLPPSAAVELEQACAATAADQGFRQHLLLQGATPRFLAGADYGAWLAALDLSFAAVIAAETAAKA
jgi:tripartite-type tricarboxylate transporter receptor subunit TctC